MFMLAKPGTSIVDIFKCDWRCFRNIEGKRTDPESYSDSQMWGYICGANLEDFWIREKRMVSNILMNINKEKI